jgi:hypothetical protein
VLKETAVLHLAGNSLQNNNASVRVAMIRDIIRDVINIFQVSVIIRVTLAVFSLHNL